MHNLLNNDNVIKPTSSGLMRSPRMGRILATRILLMSRLVEFRNEAEEGLVYVRSLSKTISAPTSPHGTPGSFLTKIWCGAQDKRTGRNPCGGKRAHGRIISHPLAKYMIKRNGLERYFKCLPCHFPSFVNHSTNS